MLCLSRHAPSARSAPFIYPVNLALSLFRRLDDGVTQLHFCATPLTGIFNAPNFTCERALSALPASSRLPPGSSSSGLSLGLCSIGAAPFFCSSLQLARGFSGRLEKAHAGPRYLLLPPSEAVGTVGGLAEHPLLCFGMGLVSCYPTYV